MGHYFTSDGERISQATLDRRIRRAKQTKKENFFTDHGYFFCENCKKNENIGFLDMSHIISVQRCKDTSRAELAYEVENLRLLCRKCHREYDGLNLQFR